MSQIRGGTVTVTNGSAAVVGVGTSFLSASVGSMFTIASSGVSYQIGAIADDTHLTLSSNYAGATAGTQSYSITTSYTATRGLPYMEAGDQDTPTIFKRLALLLESLLLAPQPSPPVTITAATYTLVASDKSIIANRAGTVTLTLPSAASYSGRELAVRTIQAQTVVSASSNVVPLAGGAAGTAILAATAGKWAWLQSDGTNWQIMASN